NWSIGSISGGNGARAISLLRRARNRPPHLSHLVETLLSQAPWRGLAPLHPRPLIGLPRFESPVPRCLNVPTLSATARCPERARRIPAAACPQQSAAPFPPCGDAALTSAVARFSAPPPPPVNRAPKVWICCPAMSERPYIVGNGKMHGTRAMLSEARAIDRAAERLMKVEVALAPPFTLIHATRKEASLIGVGAQDCHAADGGAHTGDISA